MYFKVLRKLSHHSDDINVTLTADTLRWIEAFEECNHSLAFAIIVIVYEINIVFKTLNEEMYGMVVEG